MKPFASYRFQPLETLIRQELEQTQFVLPANIRCVVKQHMLLILLDYAVLKTTDEPSEHQAIQRAVSQGAQKFLASLLKLQFQGSVRCYWRQNGQRKPWASYSFRYELPSSSVDTNTDGKPVSSQLPSQVSTAPKQSQKQPAAASSVAPVQSGLVKQEQTLEKGDIKPIINVDVPPTRSRYSDILATLKVPNWRLGVGLSLTVILGTIGVGAYAWSRPCVSSACTILEQAQALNTSLAFDADASVTEVAQTYTALLDINYQLSQVPFWSPHYDEVKGLLATYETHTYQVSQVLGAQEQAKGAIASSQSPPYPLHDWQETQEQWQGAIQTLEPVSQDTIVSPLVQTQLQEYSTKLQSIEQKMEQEQIALNNVKAARKFAQIAETNSSSAVSVEQLQQVEANWQNALDQLTNVSAETMAYAEAEHLQAIYYPQLLAVRDRLEIEALAEQAYNQAIIFAEQSTAFEQEQQWSLAVQRWQQALEQINQVPENTIYYEQVFPLVTSYTTALTNAQDHLRKAVAVQKAQQELAKRCSVMSEICEAVTADHDLHVRLAAHSNDSGAEQSSELAPGLKNAAGRIDDSTNASVAPQSVNLWLSEISTIGKMMQVSINVYNPDGTILGTYSPQSASFVRTATTVDAELDTTVVTVTPEAS